MLPITNSYSVYPSVVRVGGSVKMTVVPAERGYIITDGKVYTIKVISVSSDDNYYRPQNHKTLEAVAERGVLCFDFEFEREGEHLIHLIFEEKVVQSFTVYALFDDLYELRPLKGDLHSHSIRSDGSRDPASQAGYYREHGYDFVALTDHNRFFPGGEIDEAYDGVNTGLVRIPGEEVHSPTSPVHIVAVGGKKSVAEIYTHDRENYEAQISEYMEKVPEDIPEAFKSRYAKVMWATDSIHKAGGLAIFPHPFWRPKSSNTYNVTAEYARILLSSGMFDAYELVGSMDQPDINRSIALWTDLRGEGVDVPVVGSSDAHTLERSKHFPIKRTVCFAKEKSADSIIDAVKEGMCVAVESTGYEYDIQHRCYGKHRLVSYAHFLLSEYFTPLERITAGVGVAMRAYAMCEGATKETVESMNAIADRFTERFFGRCEPPLPTDSMIAFEEKWRKIQLAGPKTKGSNVDGTPAKSLI